jgi:ATP-binding cassette, subfamily B, bacterial
VKLIKEVRKLFEYFKWIAKKSKHFTGYIVIIMALDAVSALSGVAIAILSKNLIDNAANGLMNKAFVFAAMFGGLILASLGLRAISSMISIKTRELLSNDIRQKLFAKIANTQWLSISKYHSGDVLTRLTSDVGTVSSSVVDTLPSILSLGIQLTAAFATLLYFEPGLAILAFILGPFTVLFSRIWGKKLKTIHVKVQESESAYRAFIQEAVENILIVKTFRMENRSVENINKLHKNRIKWVVQRNKTSVAASTILGLGYWAGYFMAFCWGAVKLSKGTTTFGTLTAFLQLVEQVQGPFIGLSSTLPQIIAAMVSAGRLMELEKLPLEECFGELPPYTSTGLCFRDITYSYPNSKPVLKNISTTIYSGEIVALVGPSGEGKTTFIRMILALLKADHGDTFFIDSYGTQFNVSAQTRDWISYVPQGNTLFSGTIAENLKAGYPNASLEELEWAIQAACASDFISELPNGIDTAIGEKGIGLSEGQAQRIAIARALLRKTPILILDEATSSLDMNTEMKVLQSIQEMQPQRTCIVITHRPSALSICSRVLKLKDGRLMEEIAKDELPEQSESA